MTKQNYSLNYGEKIVFKTSCVKRKGFSAYRQELILTNRSIILEKYGVFNNFVDMERYYYRDINQAIQIENSNGTKQLELYFDDKIEIFILLNNEECEFKVLLKVINDQMSEDAEYYDFNYYNEYLAAIKEDNKLNLFKLLSDSDEDNAETEFYEKGIKFAGKAAKNILKSENFGITGVAKGLLKTATSQQTKNLKKSVVNGFFGTDDEEDSIPKNKNYVEPTKKLSNVEKLELQKLDEIRRKKGIPEDKEESKEIDKEENFEEEIIKDVNKSNLSIDEQIQALIKLKELLDVGILTQEEFDKKKKEIMN